MEPDYYRNCEKEPIGKELFRMFCEMNPKFKEAIDFLDYVVSNINTFCIHSMLNCHAVRLGFVSFDVYDTTKILSHI